MSITLTRDDSFANEAISGETLTVFRRFSSMYAGYPKNIRPRSLLAKNIRNEVASEPDIFWISSVHAGKCDILYPLVCHISKRMAGHGGLTQPAGQAD